MSLLVVELYNQNHQQTDTVDYRNHRTPRNTKYKPGNKAFGSFRVVLYFIGLSFSSVSAFWTPVWQHTVIETDWGATSCNRVQRQRNQTTLSLFFSQRWDLGLEASSRFFLRTSTFFLGMLSFCCIFLFQDFLKLKTPKASIFIILVLLLLAFMCDVCITLLMRWWNPSNIYVLSFSWYRLFKDIADS